MDGVSGLLLTGGGDVSPALYGETPEPGGAQGIEPERDEMEMALFRHAIEGDMPTLGICRGMQLINVAMGGRLIQDLPGHTLPEFQSAVHQVYVSPGSRFGAIIGAGAIYRTNSRHHQGLKEAQRAPCADGVRISPGGRHRGGAGEPGTSMARGSAVPSRTGG